MTGITLGAFLAILGGAINGSFALPMKLTRKWSWENNWFPYSILSLGLFPWLIAITTVPALFRAFSQVSSGSLIIAVLWGVSVYTGSLLFGISLTYLGTALAFALLVGTMCIVGVLLPIAIFNPETLENAGGKWIVAGVLLMLVALVSSIRAGKLRSQTLGDQNVSGIGDKVKRSTLVGMLLAIIGGALSGLLSLGMNMSWAKEISAAAVQVGGAAPHQAVNAILALVLLGGAIPNIIYCIYLLSKNQTWKRYQVPKTGLYWLVLLLIGVMYSGSVALWGMSTAENMLGKLGPSIGWALNIGMIVISSNGGGFATGEWKNSGAKAIRTMLIGLAIMMLAMAFIGYGNLIIASGN